MDGPFPAAATLPQDQSPVIEATSSEYLGRWNRLVSQTNWEKGRIICQWRGALVAAAAGGGSYTDEAWSRRVGNVSPQHVGRLRRVYQRFGATQDAYHGLYWSHFQTALDWDDAEMWLEGAVQNQWSVAEMQVERARTLGTLDEPGGCAPPPAEMDEDAPPGAESASATISGSLAEAHEAESADDAAPARQDDLAPDLVAEEADFCPAAAAAPLAPLENLPPLPDDVRDAFEAFKLAIIRHRLAGWQAVSLADLLVALEALRQLAAAPGQA